MKRAFTIIAGVLLCAVSTIASAQLTGSVRGATGTVGQSTVGSTMSNGSSIGTTTNGSTTHGNTGTSIATTGNVGTSANIGSSAEVGAQANLGVSTPPVFWTRGDAAWNARVRNCRARYSGGYDPVTDTYLSGSARRTCG